jgi:hypothetical protein
LPDALARTKKWRAVNSDKVAAHRLVHVALLRGDLERLPCFVCAKAKAEAHHDDYSKPLDVIWLCRQHHRELHSS